MRRGGVLQPGPAPSYTTNTDSTDRGLLGIRLKPGDALRRQSGAVGLDWERPAEALGRRSA